MNYITSTQLRTQSTKFIDALKRGDKITLIHRSKVLGTVVLEPDYEPKRFDAEKFKSLVENLHLPTTTPAQRERIYRDHLMKKHCKNLPRR